MALDFFIFYFIFLKESGKMSDNFGLKVEKTNAPSEASFTFQNEIPIKNTGLT